VFRQLRIPAFNIFSRQVSSCQARCEFFPSLHFQFFSPCASVYFGCSELFLGVIGVGGVVVIGMDVDIVV